MPPTTMCTQRLKGKLEQVYFCLDFKHKVQDPTQRSQQSKLIVNYNLQY